MRDSARRVRPKSHSEGMVMTAARADPSRRVRPVCVTSVTILPAQGRNTCEVSVQELQGRHHEAPRTICRIGSRARQVGTHNDHAIKSVEVPGSGESSAAPGSRHTVCLEPCSHHPATRYATARCRTRGGQARTNSRAAPSRAGLARWLGRVGGGTYAWVVCCQSDPDEAARSR